MQFVEHLKKGNRVFALYKISKEYFKLCDITYDINSKKGIIHTVKSLGNFFRSY